MATSSSAKTQLAGTAAIVEEQCRGFMQKGCAGADILAYRATEADPIDLVRAARRGIGENGYLIVAGSISSLERIRQVKAAGANAFTIGSAVFDGSYRSSRNSNRFWTTVFRPKNVAPCE